MLKLISKHQKSSFVSKAGGVLRAFSTDIKVPTMEDIGRNINQNQY